MRTLWTILVAIVAGFVAQAQQQVNNFRVLTNLYVGNAITGLTLNGYNIDAIATNSAAGKLDITNGTAVNLTFNQTPEAAAASFLPADATTLHVLGNSIPAGGTVSALSLAYGSLTAADLGLTQNLLANPSFNICDVNWSSFAGWTVTNTVGTTLVGTTPTNIDTSTVVLLDNSYNDVRGAATATQFGDGLRHLIGWWAIPHSAKRMAQTAATTGTWTNLTWLGNGDIGSVGTTDSATLTFTNVIGSDIVVSYLGWATNYGATITVTIDGVAQDAISTASKAYGNREYVNGTDSNIPDRVGPYGNGKLDFCPQSVRYTGLGMSGHTVVITTSNTSNGGAYVLWVAGNGWTREANEGPYAILPSTPSQGTWTAGGSDARQASFNLQIAAEIRAAQASGLRVLYAPLAEAIIPATYVNDGVHWSNAGHRAAADAMLTPFYLDLPYAGALRVESSGSSSGGIGSFTSLTVTGTSDLNTLDTSGAATIGGNLTGEGRLLMLPTASTNGTSSRFGYGSVNASSFSILHSVSGNDTAMTATGNLLYATENSSGATTNLLLGNFGYTVNSRGSHAVAEDLTVAGVGSFTTGLTHIGYLRHPYTAYTSNQTLTDANHIVHFNDTAGNITVTLPDPVGRAGQMFVLVKTGGTNTTTVTGANVGGDYVLASTEGIVIESNDVVWRIVAGFGGKLSNAAATTSAELAGVLSDETGTGVFTRSILPTFNGLTSSSGAVTFNSAAGADDFVISRSGVSAFNKLNFSGARPNWTLSSPVMTIGNSAANAANKSHFFGPLSYLTAEAPFYGVGFSAVSGGNTLLLGGGTGSGSAATAIQFYTAAATGTATGTLRGTVTSAGVLDWDGSIDVAGTIELGHASDTTLARSAAGVVTIEGVTVAERPTTTALTYSGTNVTLTATSHVLHGNTLTLTNNCLLTITSSDGASGGITIVPDSSTSYTVYLDSAIKLLGGGSSFVVTNSATETVNLEWKQTKRGASSVILANKAVYP